jgi:hypothetical protein
MWTRRARARLATLAAAACAAACGAEKKLIEFGWDEPDTGFRRRHAAQIEAAPFDGCVFNARYRRPDGSDASFTWEVWGRRAIEQAALSQAFLDVKATRFERERHDFLRVNVTPGDVDWFDDFAPVRNNLRLAALLAKSAGAKGLLFDVEQYRTPLFDYPRAAARRSWADTAAQARRRGRATIEAMQEGFPGLTLFLTFGHTLAWNLSDAGRRPLAETPYGLLAPFLDGLFDGARGVTRIVDGYELAYGFRSRAEYLQARSSMKRDVLGLVASPPLYSRFASSAFGIWLDYDWRRRGWSVQAPHENHFPPDIFERSLSAALELSDEYVWIYTETPRWWTEEGTRRALPDEYVEAVRRARRTGGLDRRR